MKTPLYCTAANRPRPIPSPAPRAAFRPTASAPIKASIKVRAAPCDKQSTAPWLVGVAALPLLFGAYFGLTSNNEPPDTKPESRAFSREDILHDAEVQASRRYVLAQLHNNQIGQKIDGPSRCLYRLYPNGLSLNHDENNQPDCNHAAR